MKKVHGIYRVKRIDSEDKFQKINDKIDNFGFYYHGTSFNTSQKILGQTGGFKVFKSQDSDKIKSDSMLGYGMNQKDTDTVFVDRPDVLNPEWVVKRAEQDVPRLLIDAERIYN